MVDTIFYTPYDSSPRSLINDVRTLKPKIGLESDQMKIDLKRVFMENKAYFGSIKLFLEKKDHENPRACICTHAYAYACSISAYAYMCMRTHARVPEIMEDKFSAFKLGLEWILHCLEVAPKPLFFDYIKS